MTYSNLFLAITIFLGAAVRFTNLNWDSYQAFHPDERNISWAVTRIRFFSQMNPQFFAYGGLPIYLYRAIGELVVAITKDTNWLFDWGHIALIGRYVSATLSSISIFLIFLVAKRLFSRPVGLIAAILLSFSPWAIREAHFATTETMLVFFLLLLLIFSQRVMVSGVILALAAAAKTTGLLFALVAPLRSLPIAAIVFLIFSPYTILDWQHFKESMDYETGVALGSFPVPYTLQFLGTPPYFYQIKTMLWQSGPFVIPGLIGLLFLFKKTTFVIFPIIYFFWEGSWFAKFARYNVPLLPFLTISAAWLLVLLYKRFRLAGAACIASVTGLSIFWGLANWTIYLHPQTRVEASRWIIKNIPATATIYTEHWNDGLPVWLPGDPTVAYKRELLNVYDADTEEKKQIITKQLEKGDYIILSTRRIWGTMPKLTDRYPFTSELYRKLLNGESDYKEIATFTSYPSLFGITVNDDTAEESIQVFDHPKVRIFQKNAHQL